MEKIEYLPLGSIVLIKGSVKKLMIVGRGIQVKPNPNSEPSFFDYCGIPYPEGLINDKIAYFNQDGVNKVIFKGFVDEDDKVMVDNINDFFISKNIEKTKVEEFQTKIGDTKL